MLCLVAESLYVPTSSVQGFPFIHILYLGENSFKSELYNCQYEGW